MSTEAKPTLHLVTEAKSQSLAASTTGAAASTTGASAGATAIDGELPDDELLALARGGEQAAFEAIVRRHQRRVIGFAARFFGNPAIATDVAQDVFVDLLRALPRYQPQGRFTIYLYRLTLNRCRMAARAFRYEDRARVRLFVERGEGSTGDSTATRERERRLQRALLTLPEKQRAVLQLRFWGGLSHAEIAEVLETPEGTVKSRLWNGLAMLREQLGELP